ncbi:MAG TPA: hypothetical protein PLI57_06540, partial [Spirochaetota bacterium]|nr:hypothetical protein [Spirochaetota bacterium]
SICVNFSMSQLSRPDKSGNSRFEYTKMLNDAHAGTLSGACAGAHMCQFIRRGRKRDAYSSICVNFRRVAAAAMSPICVKFFLTHMGLFYLSGRGASGRICVEFQKSDGFSFMVSNYALRC